MDNRIGAWWKTHKPTKRRLVQVYAALLYNAHIKGFIKGNIYTGPLKNVCVPGFNCYSCPGAVGSCPLGALQNALAASNARAPYYMMGILLLFGLILGRTICGWICPLGMIQELLHKIPTPKIRKGPYTRVLSWLKYVVLLIFVVAIPLIYSVQKFPVPGFCKYICPAGTLEGAIALLSNPANTPWFSMLNILFTRKFIILIIILTACVFLYRAFCRFLCPLGAIYGLFARVALVGVKVEESVCTHCGRCVAHCEMDIKKVGDHECIHCGACMDVCPIKAIEMKCGKLTLLKSPAEHEPDKVPGVKGNKRPVWTILCWSLAVAVLAGVLWYVNKPADAEKTAAPVEQTAAVQQDAGDGTEQAAVLPTELPGQQTTEPAEEEIPVGYQVHMRCPSFSVPLYGEEGGTYTYTPGKVTVINFWATYCTPCVGELPYFQKLYDTYGAQIDIIAIHANLTTDDVQAYLNGTTYTMPFGWDETGEVMKQLGGSVALPMTVIVDADGVIVYNQEKSVTYALLESTVSPLLQP